MLDCLDQFSVFHIRSSDSILTFFLKELIIDNFLQADSLIVQQTNEAFPLSTVSHHMIGVITKIIDIELVENHITRSSHLHLKIKSNVSETEVTSNVNRGSSSLVSHVDEPENFSLTQFRTVFLEESRNLSDLSCINTLEQSTNIRKIVFL
jgi:hypothetical protein